MIANNGTVLKYTDFGLACEIDIALKERVGTPRYTAPEIYDLLDVETFTKESDIW